MAFFIWEFGAPEFGAALINNAASLTYDKQRATKTELRCYQN